MKRGLGQALRPADSAPMVREEPMMPSFTLSEAVAVYFEAKKLLFQDAPEFRLLDVGPLKCIHNHPRWPEVDGFYTLDVTPAEVIKIIQRYGPDPKHLVTAIDFSPDSQKDAYLELGYRLLPWAQPFMVKPLSELPDLDKPSFVQMHQTPTTADYWVEEDGQPVCWGKSMMTSANAIYVSGMETLPTHRRRGLASALLRRIHDDALASGANHSVLCSTPLGLPLYLAAGYDVLAYMQAFVPVH